MDDGDEIIAELAITVVLRTLSPSLSTQPQLLADRACALLVNLDGPGKPSTGLKTQWSALLEALTSWAVDGIPKRAATSADEFDLALREAGVGPFGACIATAMARAMLLAAALVDPHMLDALVLDAAVSLMARLSPGEACPHGCRATQAPRE